LGAWKCALDFNVAIEAADRVGARQSKNTAVAPPAERRLPVQEDFR
jgi:hypothetical protein